MMEMEEERSHFPPFNVSALYWDVMLDYEYVGHLHSFRTASNDTGRLTRCSTTRRLLSRLLAVSIININFSWSSKAFSTRLRRSLISTAGEIASLLD